MRLTAQKVRFQTSDQNARLSRAFGLYAFAPSQDAAREIPGLNEASTRLHGAIKPLFQQFLLTWEVLP